MSLLSGESFGSVPHAVEKLHFNLIRCADLLAEPARLEGDLALQRLGDLVQDRAHVEVQGRALVVVGQKLAARAKLYASLRLILTRRQGVGLVGEPEPMAGVVVGQRSALLVEREVQVSGHRAAPHLKLPHEVAAVRQIAGLGAFAHHLDHAPDAVVLRSGTRLHHVSLNPLEELFRARLITFLVEKGLLPPERANMLCGWVHSGFNVHAAGAYSPTSAGTWSASPSTSSGTRLPWRRCRSTRPAVRSCTARPRTRRSGATSRSSYPQPSGGNSSRRSGKPIRSCARGAHGR